MFRNFSFDLLSYLLGLLSGLLIWAVVSQARNFFPQLARLFKERYEEVKKQQQAGADGAIRQSVFRKAQASHVGSFFVPLDEILIQPQLLAPPVSTVPGTPPPPESIADQLIPFLPFHPEFTAAFSPHRLSLLQVLASGTNIAITGIPGSGKTVALACLASMISRPSDVPTRASSYLPIYLHVHDLDLSQPPADPFSFLFTHVQKSIPLAFQKQVPATVYSALKLKKLVFILDGLDELHPITELPPYAAFIQSLQKQQPDLQMVVSANPKHMAGLIQAHFVPFILAPFSEEQKNQLFDRWAACWAKYVHSPKSDVAPIDPRLEKQWERWLPGNLNPLEHTLRIWSLLAGDLQQAQISYAGLETFLNRSLASETERLSLEKLAAQFVVDECSGMSYSTMESILNRSKPAPEKSTAANLASTDSKDTVRKVRMPAKGDRKSSGAQLIDSLISAGILREYTTGKIGFSHPQITGYLAAFGLPVDLPRSLFANLFWETNSETLHYLVTQGGNDLWIETILRLEDRPLYWNHFTIARWLKDTPPSSPWRPNFLRLLISLLHKENLPLPLRAAFYAALLSSGDASLGVVVKQLLVSNSQAIRRLSALAAGYLHANGMVNDLLGLMSDPNPEVSLSSILALGAFNTPQAQDIEADILLNAGELERQAAAEALARSKKGQQVLMDALSSDDLLARRSAVHGLSLHPSSEIQRLMEKVSVEDGQWIVRTAASEALEWMHRPDPHLPIPLTEPAETPWLVSFVSKSGMVLSRGQAIIPILLDALKNGTPEERLRAVDYLSHEQDEGVFAALYSALYGPSELLSRSALNALWHMSASGATLPPQEKYGFS